MPSRARQSRGAKPHQAAGPRGGAPPPGSVEPTVVHRHQSAAQSPRCSGSGTPEGNSSSLSAMQWIVTWALRVYKLVVSPLLPSACRFYPTCSDYMHEAVERHGARRSEEHTSELQSLRHLVCRLLLAKK